MSAQRLREAAKVLRERAEAASEGPWEAWEDQHAEFHVSKPGRRFFHMIAEPGRSAGDYGKQNALYIATMHPGVGLALADWLDAEAEVHYYTPWAYGNADRVTKAAHLLADLILGGDDD